MLFTPDPYLALLFRDLFGRYGHVGVAPYRDGYGLYAWQLWVCLPLNSFRWLLKKKATTPVNDSKLYDALGVNGHAEGTINAWKPTKRRATAFRVALYNEKQHIVEPFYWALTHLGYNPRMDEVPKGRMTHYGPLNNDCYGFIVYNEAGIRRLLERIKPALFHKRLKACLIRHALSDPEETAYWEDVEPLYEEIDKAYDELLSESKHLAERFYERWQKLKEIARKEYEVQRSMLEAKV